MKPRAAFPIAGIENVEVLRPLLEIGRAELRAFLIARGTPWFEDPMNEDSRFARARLRKALPTLEAAGISARRIAQAARHLSRAREALESATKTFLTAHARLENRDFALLDAAALARTNRETGLRALSALLLTVSGSHRPRFERLEACSVVVAGSFAGARTHRVPDQPRPQARRLTRQRLIAREPGRNVDCEPKPGI
jgi:tRNA(Ile)-lysidine synthase